MAVLNIKTFDDIVTQQVTAQQAQAAQILDFTPGSVLLATDEAAANVAIWQQSQIVALLGTTRAATSEGPDLDSFFADFGFTRLTAVTATGNVTFSRFSPTQQAIIVIGATVQSADGLQNYTVALDAANPLYDSGSGGYVVPIGTATATVPIMAAAAGIAANVSAGIISVITSPIPSIDTVTNASAVTSGKDAESDPAFRSRFLLYIASLEKGTISAVAYAIVTTQTGLMYTIIENYDYAGAILLGFFYAVIDDGSGAPGAPLLETIRVNVKAVKPLCSTFLIYAPVIITADVAMSITVAVGDGTAERALVETSLTNYLNASILGTNVQYTLLSQVARAASTNITNVSPGYTLNGVSVDMVATNHQVIKAGTVVII